MERIEKFEDLFGAELEVRGEQTSQHFGAGKVNPELAKRRVAKAQRKLFDMLDALTPEEQAQYGDYRKAILAENAARKA